MSLVKKIATGGILVLVGGALLIAQIGDGQRPEPNYDEAIAHLSLNDSNLACLEANKDAFREAVGPSAEQLRDLQRQLRQAARNGEDTTAFQSEMDAVRSSIQSIRTTFVSSAQGCLDTNQQTQMNDLIAAETLLNEVRQSVGLLLMESTEERAGGAAGGFRGRRGRR